MNACKKGKAGEREAAHYINDMFPGLNMRRGAQHAGNADAPDINGFPGVHWEVKRAEKLNIHAAMKQAIRDSEGKAVPVVLHRRNRGAWLVTLEGNNLIAFAKAVILANEAGLASNAGQEADKAVERVESKPSAKYYGLAQCSNCAHAIHRTGIGLFCHSHESSMWGHVVESRMLCGQHAFAALPATQEGQSSGKSVSAYGSDGEGLESRNVKEVDQ